MEEETIKKLIESGSSAKEILGEAAQPSSKDVNLKAGKNTVKLRLVRDWSNWSLLNRQGHVYASGYIMERNNLGFESMSPALEFFEDEIKDLIRKEVPKLAK